MDSLRDTIRQDSRRDADRELVSTNQDIDDLTIGSEHLRLGNLDKDTRLLVLTPLHVRIVATTIVTVRVKPTLLVNKPCSLGPVVLSHNERLDTANLLVRSFDRLLVVNAGYGVGIEISKLFAVFFHISFLLVPEHRISGGIGVCEPLIEQIAARTCHNTVPDGVIDVVMGVIGVHILWVLVSQGNRRQLGDGVKGGIVCEAI